ncbi:HAD-IA family hydrolase [Candidatus Micrarchaeota archaeon]|nr:HAD-IA family hydrolase [Candidatus Micrarchaeota archaeon]
MHFTAVLFDWDGTLYDSIDASFKIYKELFKKYANLDLTCDYFRETFIVDYHKYYSMHGIPESKWEEVDDHWLKRFHEMEGEIHLFPGVKEMLGKLSEEKIKIGLVSNGTGDRIKKEMKKNGISEYFAAVITDDEVSDFKPNPKGVKKALEIIGVGSSEALYIGDMSEDIEAGRNAGTGTAAVTWGAHSAERLSPAKPDYILNSVNEIFGIL